MRDSIPTGGSVRPFGARQRPNGMTLDDRDSLVRFFRVLIEWDERCQNASVPLDAASACQ
jgi:hypothetical protein